MKKIILFEDLDKINFYFSLFLIPFFKKIYFRKATYAGNHFFFKKNLEKLFFEIGLKDLTGKETIRSINLKKYLSKKYINNNFQHKFFYEFCNLNKMRYEDDKKIIFTLENHIFLSPLEYIDSSSYICFKIFFPNNLTYYVPSSEKSLLLMREIKNKNFKVVGMTVLITELLLTSIKIFKVIFNKINFFIKSNNEIKKNKNIEKRNCSIGYFPHGGLKYGNFFKKNFFYQQPSTSPLYKTNIDTLSFEPFDKLTLRYLRFFNLSNTQLHQIASTISWKYFYTFMLFILKNKKFIKKNKFLNLKIFFQFYLSIQKYNIFFKNNNYKYLFFDNDTLISYPMLLAASLNKIKTISLQDRLTSYIFYHRGFFDLYMLAGIGFKKILRSKYIVEHYEILGLTRSKLIRQDKEILKEKNNVVACLLNGVTSDSRNNILGNDGSSLKSNLNFCKDIVKLSKIFKNKNFIIKHKMIIDPVLNDESIKTLAINVSDVDEYILGHNKLITAVNKIIYSSNNVFWNREDKIKSTDLISQSELVIGKTSTILEESLLSNKNVLIHDEEKFASSLNFYKKNKFLIVDNYDDLLFKTKSILERSGDFYQYYIERKSNYIKDYLTNQGIVGSQKKILEILEKYIKNIN